MASHFKLYDGLAETVPWPARYSFPTQANRTWKSTVKIPPVNGAAFNNLTFQQPIRINFPANGYMNTTNSFLSFNVHLNSPTAGTKNLRIQNDINSLFKRGRLVYGNIPLEDIREMHALCRVIGEGGATHMGILDQTSIAEGRGGLTSGYAADGVGANGTLGRCSANARVLGIQVHEPGTLLDGGATDVVPFGIVSTGTLAGVLTNGRRYCTQLPFGLFTQNKLIPFRFMAASLYMELEMARSVECLAASTWIGDESFTLDDVAFIAEVLDFDGSYDAAFLDGLKGDGVPIKFATWDTFMYSTGSAGVMNFLIPERNRSVKAVFAVQLAPPALGTAATTVAGAPIDSHAFYQSTEGWVQATPYNTAGSCVRDFQYRVGTKYYPSQPVLCGSGIGKTNGCAEAFIEYQKAMNMVGDYRLSTALTTSRWSRTTGLDTCLQQSAGYDWFTPVDAPGQTVATYNIGLHGPAFFVMAVSLESSDGSEVSGINGEEQNDIALNINYAGGATGSPQLAAAVFNIYVYYDAMILLKEGNYVELIK